MRLVRAGAAGLERPGLMVDDSSFVDVSHVVPDFDTTFFGGDGIARLRRAAPYATQHGRRYSVDSIRLGPPIARPHQIVCIGLNYRDHAEETGQPIPEEPIVFTKAPNTLVGPNDDVVIPQDSTKTDYEVELGIVIGRRAYCLAHVGSVTKHIAGYVLVNDVSEREFQMERGGQWTKGKSCPTFNPCGPWLVTPDEIDDPGDLDIWLDVNGQRRQEGNTRTMLFDAHRIVHYLSHFMALEPGDLINTGTPPGVGMGMSPPAYLRAGDTMDLSITGLGRQRQHLVTRESSNR